jgi:hypothetical protein
MLVTNPQFAKITVSLERRTDGGLRAWSDDVPGFVLSNPDSSVVLDAIESTLEFILSSMWGVRVSAKCLPTLSDLAEDDDACNHVSAGQDTKEYVAYPEHV